MEKVNDKCRELELVRLTMFNVENAGVGQVSRDRFLSNLYRFVARIASIQS
jgi:hypothetical protein